MSSYSRQQLEAWLKTISVPASSRVLDVGGSQNPVTSRLGDTGNGSTYTILDLENPHELKEKPLIVFNLNEKGNVQQYWAQYDIAFCLEVSEYWWNPLQALESIKSLLVVGGTLYISFHFLYPHHKPFEQDYLRYTRTGAEKLLSEAGFRIEDVVPRTANMVSPEVLYSAEGMRGKKDNEIGCLIKAVRIQ